MSTTALIVAQESTPEIKPQDRKFNKKKDQGPRAVGLVQIASNGKATLVPITIRVDGKFYDAAAYKADPVPMALEPGTVYETERSGKSLGLFTVAGALHSNAINAATPWLGTGLWLPEGTETPRSGQKAERVPVGIESSDAPPRLTKGMPGTPVPEAPGPGSQTPPVAPAPEAKPSSESKSGQNTSESSAKDGAKQADHSPASAGTNSSAEDSNRPRLRRGKPTQPLPSDDDVPGYSKPGSLPSGAAKGAEASAGNSSVRAAADKTTQLIPGVSDADGPNPRSYAFEWVKGEEADRRKQVLDLARDQLRLYLAKQAKSSIPANSAVPRAASRRPAPKPAEPVFENVEMRTFDLWANNQPIMVLSAEARVAAPPEKSAPGQITNVSAPYTVTLVARTDIYDNVHKLYSGITDKYHLDVTPRLELIDAVDADGDGRGELLFRETSDAGSGFVIYRATADTLWKMFDSLNPQ